MILIAPDKYKGTLTASEAAAIMAQGFAPLGETLVAPMADGGEGTAEILQSIKHDPDTVYIDSSSVIGLQQVDPTTHNILTATSAPLGEKVRECILSGVGKIVIGIGGTATCDGGLGFLGALSDIPIDRLRDTLVGLSDVQVPLVAPGDTPSALMFAPQKGATEADLIVLRDRLEKIYAEYPQRSPFDGAGGGLGFAIASAIGAPCHPGAEYALDKYNIHRSQISLIVTGEGCIDRQTDRGKVVGTLARVASDLSIPMVAFGGTVAPGMESDTVIATDRYLPDLPLNKETAALRLRAAVEDYVNNSI